VTLEIAFIEIRAEVAAGLISLRIERRKAAVAIVAATAGRSDIGNLGSLFFFCLNQSVELALGGLGRLASLLDELGLVSKELLERGGTSGGSERKGGETDDSEEDGSCSHSCKLGGCLRDI
jgi:hypothetical protein